METQVKESRLAGVGRALVGAVVMVIIISGAWNISRLFPIIPKTMTNLSVAAVTLFQSFIPGNSQTNQATTTIANITPTTTPISTDEVNNETDTETELISEAPELPEPSSSTPEIKTAATPSTLAGPKTETVYQIGNTPTIGTSAKPDLVARITDVGIIDKNTNEFTSTTSPKYYDRVAVKFEVINKGGAETGSWFFNAVLPTYPMHIFTSPGQQSLKPGDRIEFTIGFDSVMPDTESRFVINADPTSSLSELNEENNIASTTIRAVSN